MIFIEKKKKREERARENGIYIPFFFSRILQADGGYMGPRFGPTVMKNRFEFVV